MNNSIVKLVIAICNNNSHTNNNGKNVVVDEKSVETINQNRMKVADYEMIKCIGRGAFGEVQLVSGTPSQSSEFDPWT